MMKMIMVLSVKEELGYCDERKKNNFVNSGKTGDKKDCAEGDC